MNHAAEPVGPQPTNVRWTVFVLCCGSSWFLYLHRYTFALIKPSLIREWGLDEAELGLLDSAFSLCYSVFQFPLGLLADFSGAHLFLGGMILLWSVALGLHAWAPSLKVLQLARALFGLGQAAAFASVARITRTWFPGSVRTTVQGWVGVFFGRMGGMSANLLFALLLVGVIGFGWRTAIYLFAVAGLIHGLAFLFLFRNSPRKHPRVNTAEADLIEEVAPHSPDRDAPESTTANEPPRKRMALGEMFGRMSLRSILNLLCLNLQSMLSTIADNIFSNWIPLFLAVEHGLKFKEMGIYSALPLLGGALGGVTGGWLNDRLISKTGNRRFARSSVGLVGKGLAGLLIFTALTFYYDDPYVFCTFLFFVKFFGDWSLASGWGTVTEIGGKATASVFAFNNSVAGIGAIIAPVMYGFLARDYSWKAVFIVAGVAYFCCAASWLLVNCTIPILRGEPDQPPAVDV